MSKARLIITAVTVEGRSQREVARAYGINQRWVSRLVARYHAEARPRSSHAHAAPRPARRRSRQQPSR
jgi:transposase